VDPIADDEVVFSRRRILAVGGFSVGLAAVVAACAPDKPKAQVPQAGAAPSTTALAEQNVDDQVLLRTASSLEHSIADAYALVLALNVLPAETTSLVTRFAKQHKERATFFEDLTRDIGGQPFAEANEPFDKSVIEPALKSIADAGNKPADLNWFIYGLENVATGTMQSFVPILRVPNLRSAVMSVGGAEARTSAIAAALIPTFTVVPPTTTQEEAAAAAGTTTTTAAGVTTTTTPAAELVPVAQVPGAFGSQTAVSVAIANQEEAWNLLGPNSYEYVEAPTTTTTAAG
jgi:Ferritin-like domain